MRVIAWNKDDEFQERLEGFFFLASVLLHILVFVMIYFSGSIFTHREKPLPWGSITVRPVQLPPEAYGVPEEAPAPKPEPPKEEVLPEPPPATKVVTIPEAKVKPEIKLEIKKEKEKEKEKINKKKFTKKEDAKLKNRIKEIEKKMLAENPPPAWLKGTPGGPIPFGSPEGTAPPGTPYDECQMDLSIYWTRMKNRFWEWWIYPQMPEDLITVLEVEVARDGKVLSMNIRQGSGNRLYDESALKTFDKISPLDPIPECWKEPTLKQKIAITPVK